MLEWILRKALGSGVFEKFVGTKVAVAVAALLALLVNHGLIAPGEQATAGKLLTDVIAGLVAIAFMLARAWTDTAAMKK